MTDVTGTGVEADVLVVAEDPDHNEVLVDITDLLLDRAGLILLDEEIREKYPIAGRTYAADGSDFEARVFWIYEVEEGFLRRD